jgi:dienelactone hydrolase
VISVSWLSWPLYLSLWGVLGQAAASGTSAPLWPPWADLESGPYRVGFERLDVRDYSRPYGIDSTDPARPIPLSVWYPAEPAAEGQPVSFGRYVGAGEKRRDFVRRLNTYGFELDDEQITTILSTPTASLDDPARAQGPFPLLVFGTSLTGPSYLESLLSEYLASYGYVSVAIASLPAREDETLDYDLEAVDLQLRDMEFAIQQMHDYPEVRIDPMGLVAWSFGGVAQALLSMRNPEVGAVVSLDAATGYAYGRKLLEASLHFAPARATAPFFHASDSRESAQVEKSFRYFDDIVKGRSFLLTLEGATHAEFTSLAVVPRLLFPSEGDEPVLRRYRLLCRYVRAFLDLSLKRRPEAEAFLDVAPTRHGFEGAVLTRKR